MLIKTHAFQTIVWNSDFRSKSSNSTEVFCFRWFKSNKILKIIDFINKNIFFCPLIDFLYKFLISWIEFIRILIIVYFLFTITRSIHTRKIILWIIKKENKTRKIKLNRKFKFNYNFVNVKSSVRSINTLKTPAFNSDRCDPLADIKQCLSCESHF